MKKNYSDEKGLRLRRIQMNALKKISENNLISLKNQGGHASKLSAVIQALSWGKTREEIEKKLINFNKKYIKI